MMEKIVQNLSYFSLLCENISALSVNFVCKVSPKSASAVAELAELQLSCAPANS